MTPTGFIPTDLHGLVEGELDVYAAGDATTCPIKQGGVATQQADAAAEAIAARLGAPVEPQPFRPVLRGLLLTGGEPRYMRAEVSGGADRPAGRRRRTRSGGRRARSPAAGSRPTWPSATTSSSRARPGSARRGGAPEHAPTSRPTPTRASRPASTSATSTVGSPVAGRHLARGRSCPRRARTRPTARRRPGRRAPACPTSPKPARDLRAYRSRARRRRPGQRDVVAAPPPAQP